MAKYSQEQLWKLFDKLPDDLKDVILSEDTANIIREICQRNEIGEEDIPRLAGMVGDILMGLLPPENFKEEIEKELKINEDRAEKISREVNRFILFPVKDSLEEFYKEIRFAPGGKIMKPSPAERKEKERIKSDKEEPSTKDIYREPIE